MKTMEMAQEQEVLELPNDVFLKEVKALVADGHRVTLRVRGVSMRPFLEDRRDRIVLEKPSSPQVGDAVLAEIAPGKYVYHRIVTIKDDMVTLKGDGNIWGVEQCRIEDIAASTYAFIRKGREYFPQGGVWRWYSFLWPQWPFARRVLLKMYRIFRR